MHSNDTPTQLSLPLTTEQMKRCIRCGEVKPWSAFHMRSEYPRPQSLCKECKNQYRREYRAANREKVREKNRAYYLANKERQVEWYRVDRKRNPEKYRARERRWYHKNRARIRARKNAYWRSHYDANQSARVVAHVAVWRRRNPEKLRGQRLVQNSRRRTRVLAGGTFTRQEWEALKQRFDYTCLCCGKREPEIELTVDHVVPISLGGSNTVDNLQPLCGPCNFRKNAKVIDYRPAQT